MPSLLTSTGTSTPWRDAAPLASTGVEMPWRDGVLLWSIGSPYTPGPGGTGEGGGGSLDAGLVIPAQDVYNLVHTVAVTDLSDGAPLEFYSLSMSTDADSVCWTLTAEGSGDMFDRLTPPGVVPPVIEVMLDGVPWHFLIESVRRSGRFGETRVSVTGRSATMVASEPYSFPQNWINDGEATAAQVVDQSLIYTGVELAWLVEDWLIPDRVWSFSGSPLAVAKRVAESVGAVVRSDRSELRLNIEPRYEELPNRWPIMAPDVEIHGAAVMVDNYERADQPAYTGVYVSGHQQGGLGHVRLSWTAGDVLAPYVTDLLLTEPAAITQRGQSILGAAGTQARVQLTLPVLPGVGVLEVGMLCRVIEPRKPKWWGVVRAVRVDVAMPEAVQMVTLERHTEAELDNKDDIWTCRGEQSKLTFWGSYAADFPGLMGLTPEGSPLAFTHYADGGSGDPEIIFADINKSIANFKNPHIGPEFQMLPVGVVAGQAPGTFFTFTPGSYAMEFEVKQSGNIKDICVGIKGGYKFANGSTAPVIIPMIHQAGLSNPFGIGVGNSFHAEFPRIAAPKLVETDVVGVVQTVRDASFLTVTVYVNGVRLLSGEIPEQETGAGGTAVNRASGLWCGRIDPKVNPAAFRI